MSLKLAMITTVGLLYSFVTVISAPALAKRQTDSTTNTNDIITELFHNCKCIPFQECEENSYARLNSSELVKCSDPSYACCKNVSLYNTTTQKPSTYTKNTNDVITELFHNCRCVPFHKCEKDQYAKLNSSELVKCSDPSYCCCKNSESDEEPMGINSTVANTTTQEPLTGTVVPSNTNCGTRKLAIDARILNPDTNFETTDDQPWIVEIFQKIGNNKTAYRFRCFGTLIHPRVVLTAMHCFHLFSEQAIKVVATGKKEFQNIGANLNDERNVLKIVKHPKYYPLGLHNDLALLILQEEFQYDGGRINSICLPENRQVFDGEKCVAVGWGQNSEHGSTSLRTIEVPTVNFQQCQSFLRKTRLGPNFVLHESFLCAGGEEGGDTCKGDGGAPLICFGENDKYFQAGIVSWGVSCGVVDEPGVYTNVSYFKDWIVEELRNYDLNVGSVVNVSTEK